MKLLSRTCLALLCGVALIWLTQLAVALLTALPGLGYLIHWLKSNNVAVELVWRVAFRPPRRMKDAEIIVVEREAA